jgi:hypothetical protein
MTVRRRKWKHASGQEHEAWVVDVQAVGKDGRMRRVALSVFASSWSRNTLSATSGSFGSSPRKMAPRAWLVIVGSGDGAGRPCTWPLASGLMPSGNALS